MVLKQLGCTQRHCNSRVAGMLLVEKKEERGAETPSCFYVTTLQGEIHIMQVQWMP
jgi:hypothetical protein